MGIEACGGGLVDSAIDYGLGWLSGSDLGRELRCGGKLSVAWRLRSDKGEISSLLRKVSSCGRRKETGATGYVPLSYIVSARMTHGFQDNASE